MKFGTHGRLGTATFVLWMTLGLGWTFAQKKETPIFLETFEAPTSAVFSKWAGGSVRDERCEVVTREGGGKCFSISFVPSLAPGEGKFWYYAIPVDLKVDPDMKTVISFEIKFEATGASKPEVILGTAYDGYRDAAFQEVKASGWVSVHGAPATPDRWQTLQSPPFNRVQSMKDNGKDEPFIKMKRILISIRSLTPGERFTLWIDNVSVAPVSAEDVREYERKSRIAFTPSEYPIQSGRFYYGVWATPDVGNYPWWPYADIIPKKERILCNLEAMLACQFDTIFTAEIRPDGSNLDEVLSLVDTAKRFGFSSIAKTYFTPYYDRKRSLEECGAAIDRIIPILKKNDGIVSYYLIDEPEPNEETMKWWLWGKSKIGALDPSRPVTGLMDQVSKVKYFGYTEHTLAMDAYPFEIPRTSRYDESEAGGDPLAIERYLDAAQESGAKSSWMMLWSAGELWSKNFYARMPTAEELRLMSFAALAKGARGLFYFALRGILPVDSGKQEQLFGIFNEMYQVQDPFGRELLRLGEDLPVLGGLLIGTDLRRDSGIELEAETLPVSSPNKKAFGLGLYSGKDYELLIVYNRDAGKSRKGILALGSARTKSREVFDLGNMSAAVTSGGQLTLELAPGDGRFFLIASKEVRAQVVGECFARKYGSLKRRLDFLKPEAAAYGIQPGQEDGEADLLLAKDPRAAYEKKWLAKKNLSTRLGENEQYRVARKSLDEAAALYGSLNGNYRRHLAGHPGSFQIPGDPDLKRFTIDLVKLTDTYVLLRNALYAGKGKEIAAPAASLKTAVSELEKASRSQGFKGASQSDVDALFKQAQSYLGIAETCLRKP